jgi:hypothetical protein
MFSAKRAASCHLNFNFIGRAGVFSKMQLIIASNKIKNLPQRAGWLLLPKPS